MTDDTARVNRQNRLAGETSPYLLQHAGNPVDWYPWGDEAFARARAEEKPVLLSVGYSSCHWCHVMAHESFEDDSIAALMNEHFVNIKVDREERPDVDSVFMTFTQAMTGQGGWPMTVFLTPQGEPFYAGTYFPPEDQYGRPGFPRLLQAISTAWEQDREKVTRSAEEITGKVRAATEHVARSGGGPLTPALAGQAVQRLRSAFDETWGGFGQAPKFPSPGNLEFLLAHHARAGEDGPTPSALDMVLRTLHRMAEGGMYDHLGGGFSRYSVDARWLVPHFEKMLYDNAQLVCLYLHALQVTGQPAFERVVRETLRYLVREMLDEEGGFYSAQDADSEGIEGKYFVWTPDEVTEVLGEDAPLFNAVFGVSPEGNFEDPHHPEFGRRNVLSRPRLLLDVAAEFGMAPGDLETGVDEMRTRMLEAREQRVRPGLDDKVLTSWNGLALAAFAEAGRILGDDESLAVALRNARFVRERLWQDGRLLHTYKQGVARIDGLLEDYAYYGLGLIELYRATGDLDHLRWAAELLEAAVARFHDDEGGGFFETPSDGEALLVRQKPFFDAATPSGNGAMALLAIWLGRYFGRPEWEALGEEVVGQVQAQLVQAASGFGSVLRALELLLAPRRELAIVGERGARAPFERVAARHFLPATLLAPAEAGDALPVLEGRGEAAGALAYLCEDMACELPARTPEELAAQLGA
ncbi:MAG: DUF255 domain-containing protein [Dehalococcoidia bacterium]|nr:DUF255 domain-containing protein [Dehalococcoidia bacterium]